MTLAQYTLTVNAIMLKYANQVTAAQTEALKKIDVICRQSGPRECMVAEIESIQGALSKYIVDQIALREKEIDALLSNIGDEE